MIELPQNFAQLDPQSKQDTLNAIFLENAQNQSAFLEKAQNDIRVLLDNNKDMARQLEAIKRRLELLEDSKLVAIPKVQVVSPPEAPKKSFWSRWR